MSARKLSRFVGLVFVLSAVFGIAGAAHAAPQHAMAVEATESSIEWG